MQNWITDFMEAYGYLGILAMIAFENVFPPIPSEVILTFGGFMTTQSDLTVPGVIAAATAGSILGAVILFGIGRILDFERLEGIVEKWGHILRLKKGDLLKADHWFDHYGFWTVLFCRVVPLLRSLISIPAGMSNMNFWLFLLLTTIGSLVWNIALVLVGAQLGEQWEDVLKYMDVYSNIVYAVLALGIIGVIVFFVKGENILMSIYIALLRGINVSGHRLIKMADLKKMCESLGLSHVQTYIQSGNLLFESDEPAEVLEQRIKSEIAAVFGFDVPVVIRTAEQMEQIVNNCPFDVDAWPEKERPHVALLADLPSAEGLERLLATPIEQDELRVIDREVYILYRNSVHKSKLSNNLLEKKLGVSATTRNWQTMNKLVELAKKAPW